MRINIETDAGDRVTAALSMVFSVEHQRSIVGGSARSTEFLASIERKSTDEEKLALLLAQFKSSEIFLLITNPVLSPVLRWDIDFNERRVLDQIYLKALLDKGSSDERKVWDIVVRLIEQQSNLQETARKNALLIVKFFQEWRLSDHRLQISYSSPIAGQIAGQNALPSKPPENVDIKKFCGLGSFVAVVVTLFSQLLPVVYTISPSTEPSAKFEDVFPGDAALLFGDCGLASVGISLQ